MSRSSALVLVALCGVAHAQDEFEIQVYDTATAARGEPGLELHLNHHLIHAAPDQTHVTFEPHYGATDWLELGGYFQLSGVTYAGVKLRAKARLPYRLWADRIGLAINGELSAVPAQFEPSVYGGEVRPIAELRAGVVYVAVNPIVSFSREGAEFEPAAKLAWVANDTVMVGVEGYAASDVQRAFAVIDLRGTRWDVNVGVGVNRGSPDHPIAKLILGVHP